MNLQEEIIMLTKEIDKNEKAISIIIQKIVSNTNLHDIKNIDQNTQKIEEIIKINSEFQKISQKFKLKLVEISFAYQEKSQENNKNYNLNNFDSKNHENDHQMTQKLKKYEISLIEDWTYQKPHGYSFQNKINYRDHWIDIYKSILSELYQKDRKKFLEILDKPYKLSNKGKIYFSLNKNSFFSCFNFEHFYADSSLSANGIRDAIKVLFLFYKIPESSIQFYYKPHQNNSKIKY
jgi:hypothetical protein